ncbi:hypothetical protein BDQ12DRAFT_706092 [Crucibulum laeve]|uniref:Uncharacterized protein n=1 Tax=Crucibulum laeve TaxID=68775 RepID=A0A5C3LWD2_9AGAR|nr:hypothetical protein BDQ12DRAFT_706092 [Crucibulum laeve]
MNPGIQHPVNGYHPPPHNVASTSANPYPDFNPGPPNTHSRFPSNMPMRHQPSRPMQHQPMPPNNWQPPMPPNQNAHPSQPPMHPPQQQFNPSPWVNPMHPPQFQSGMPGIGGFNIPFLPQQVLHDAFAMSAPVEAADEMTLITTLIASKGRGETYKDALNSLHGKNGHSASLWKDYYLEHKDRLDSWVAKCSRPGGNTASTSNSHSEREHSSAPILPKDHHRHAIRTTKKPSPTSFKLEELSPSPSTVSAPARGRKQTSKQSTPSMSLPQPTAGGRSTINSLTAPAPVYGDRLPPPNSEIKIPDPPSRSPSPPTRIIPQGRGNKYTQEDRDFFIKFISWRLKSHPDLTRNDLCNLLAEKAPHHTPQSWASHWSNNHDLPDKILAAAQGEDYSDEDEEESSEDEKISKPKPRQRPKPKYRESSTEREEDSTDEDEEAVSDDDDDDDGSIKHWEESEMGAKGEPFTEADLYYATKYIASRDDWENTGAREKWEPFSERYPQRSWKSWSEYHRRNETVIRKLVRKMRKQQTAERSSRSSSSVYPQRAHPSLIPPKAKRKHDIDEDNGADGSRNKRGRAQSNDS